MKSISYISVIAVLVVSSCTASRVNMGGEYDDLYYSKSDNNTENKKVASNAQNSNKENDIYYDNIYSGDTLIADGYNDAVDFDGSMFYNQDGSPFEYANDYSYSNRLNRFYGNYFNPYWRDPYYYYGGYYDPYYYNPYYYGGLSFSLGFSFGYGYGYGGYNPYYGYGGYYPYYPSYPYYGGGGYYPGYYPPSYSEGNAPAAVGRRQTYSTLTSNYTNVTPSRKSAYQSVGSQSGEQRRTTATSSQNVSNDARRGSAVQGYSRQGTTSDIRNGETYQNNRKEGSVNSNSQGSRPEYNSQNRTYTPSYNNPRITERPSYNNSRVTENNSQPGSNVSNRSGGNPGTNYGRSVSEGAGLGRSKSSEGNTVRSIINNLGEGNSMIRYPSSNNYSVPSNSRSESSSSRSSNSYSGSGNSGSSGYSGGSSVSSGSSGGGGGGYESRSSGGGSGTRR